MLSLTGLSEAGLKASRSHLINSHFLRTFGVCLWVSFTRVVQSWSGALQAQIPLIHTPHRTIMFSAWFSLQGCPELACRPPVPDTINSHPLELLRFTYGSLYRLVQPLPGALEAQISFIRTPHSSLVFSAWCPSQNCLKLAWGPPGPESINPQPLQNLCFPHGFLHRIV